MTINPVKSGTINFKKCNLLQKRLLIGIDSGSSMTKILFLHKDNETQLHDDTIDYVTFTHVLFNNSHFTEAVQWAWERLYVPENHSFTVHITGNGSITNKDVIESVFGLKAEFVDEMLTISAGHRIALEQIGLENISTYYDDVGESVRTCEKEKETREDKDKEFRIFPCLIHACGSASGFFYFDESGLGDFSSCIITGGKAFMGLAKCLLDTNNFDEIMELASRGDRRKVDNEAKELPESDTTSCYGEVPPDTLILTFGKCKDYNIGLETLAKEDLALSLIALFSRTMVMQCSYIAKYRKTPKVYITGNILRSTIFRQEIKRFTSISKNIPKCEILDFGYFGTVGAMFTSNDDRAKYYKG